MKYIVWAILCGVMLFVLPFIYLVGLAWHFNHKRSNKMTNVAADALADFVYKIQV